MPTYQVLFINYSSSLIKVGIRIANDLLFRVPITVNFSLVEHNDVLTLEDAPSVPALSNLAPGILTSFKSSLAKQTEITIPFLPDDLFPKLNKYLYPYDLEIHLNPTRLNIFSLFNELTFIADLEYTLAYTLTEGLGFKLSLISTTTPDGNDILVPPIKYLPETNSTILLLPSPFDFLVQSKRIEGSIADTILTLKSIAESYGNVRIEGRMTKTMLLNNSAFLGLVERLGQMQMNGLELGLNGTNLPILTMGYPLAASLNTTAEFLMTSPLSRESLESLNRRHGIQNMYGPKTLRILEGMGYATRQRPEILKLDFQGGAPKFHNSK